jgi:hypothetical protein
MKTLLAVLLIVSFGQAAHADSCAKSRDYILNNLAGDLPRPSASYQDLFQVCLQTLRLGNVRDAYLLKDGGIAIIAKKTSISATAETLADFCRKFPRKTLRIISTRDTQRGLTTGLVVLMRSTDLTSCQKIIGGQQRPPRLNRIARIATDYPWRVESPP